MLRNISFFSAVFVLAFASELLSVTLFEIKDELGSPVLVVSTDGLRILNGADTLMVISSSEIRANIKEDATKVLSRTFSVSTTSAKGSQGNIMNVTTDGIRIYDQTDESKMLGDTLMTISSKAIKAHIKGGGKVLSRTFSVSTTSAKGAANALEVGTDYTTMSDGVGKYTNFSPENIFLGLNAGGSNTSGVNNAFMGNNAGAANTEGEYNAFIGTSAGAANTSGSSNAFFGDYAGYSNIVGAQNVMVGESAGRNFAGGTGDFGNVFIGKDAAYNVTSGDRNVAIGFRTGQCPAGTNETYGNVFVGAVAGLQVNGSYNVMLGESAGENYQSGGSSGEANVFIGKEAGQFATGDGNIYIGQQTGRGLDTNVNPGNYNIFLGRTVGLDEKGSYKLLIGSQYGNLLYGNTGTTKSLVVNGDDSDNLSGYTFYANGTAGGDYAWNSLSDERMKKNIRAIDDALDKVMKLRGVTYEWKDENSLEKGIRMGFIAQETKDVLPEVVNYNTENDIYSMQYANITAVLVEAIKELKQEVSTSVAALENKEIESKKVIDGQSEKINILINENKDLKNKVQELESLRAEIDQIKRQIAGYTSK
jgi:hypothetical protein